ncbi:hypothetical protein A3842_14480 [Paenibacillus sp. P3E]|nr:hypothetical protein A3842_14480 [Paenibacillus sp. P3E]
MVDKSNITMPFKNLDSSLQWGLNEGIRNVFNAYINILIIFEDTALLGGFYSLERRFIFFTEPLSISVRITRTPYIRLIFISVGNRNRCLFIAVSVKFVVLCKMRLIYLLNNI